MAGFTHLPAYKKKCNGKGKHITINTQMLLSAHHQHVLLKTEPHDAAKNQV
jgi:hypothetical protein